MVLYFKIETNIDAKNVRANKPWDYLSMLPLWLCDPPNAGSLEDVELDVWREAKLHLTVYGLREL